MRSSDSTPVTWRQPMARFIVIALAAIAALAAGPHRAAAQGQAWCLVGGNSGRSCGFYTFEQCLASRAGGTSHCTQNPNYQGGGSGASQPARSQRRR